MSPTVKVDPILESISKNLSDIEAVIALDNYHGTNEAQKLIARAAKAGVKRPSNTPLQRQEATLENLRPTQQWTHLLRS